MRFVNTYVTPTFKAIHVLRNGILKGRDTTTSHVNVLHLSIESAIHLCGTIHFFPMPKLYIFFSYRITGILLEYYNVHSRVVQVYQTKKN